MSAEFITKFINALDQDIKSGKHASEVNSQLLRPTIYLLSHPELTKDLSLEQIITGAINMAVALQIFKCGNISSKSVGQEALINFYREVGLWFDGYNEALDGETIPNKMAMIAIPVIERAANSRLYITPCLANTLKVYFEYRQHLDSKFSPPIIPVGHTFGSYDKNQFFTLKTKFVPSLMNLSMFVVKDHKLSTNLLPESLKEQIDNMPSIENVVSLYNNGSEADERGTTVVETRHCTII